MLVWTGILLFCLIIFVYGLCWAFSGQKFSVKWGISWSAGQAEFLGLDSKKVFLAILQDLRPESIRLAANWKEVEPNPGKYDFQETDWYLDQAQKAGVGVVMVVGQKAPRWPECHVPEWTNDLVGEQYREGALGYLTAVVERYAQHPALVAWQVENEPFIRFRFGECKKFDQDLVYLEISQVKKLDKEHPVVITDSGELSTWLEAASAGDIFGTTLYRIVQTPKGRYWHYDWLPAGYYLLKSRLLGRGYEDFWVSELQAEPWFTNSSPLDTPVAIQEKSMNPERLQKHLGYAQHMGASRVFLWGVEWWYFQKEKNNDSRYWELIKKNLNQPAN